MEISNNQSWYINPNTRQLTSNVKNTVTQIIHGTAEKVAENRLVTVF